MKNAKKTLLFLLSLILLAACIGCSGGSSELFRLTDGDGNAVAFGMSKANVEKAFGETIGPNPNFGIFENGAQVGYRDGKAAFIACQAGDISVAFAPEFYIADPGTAIERGVTTRGEVYALLGTPAGTDAQTRTSVRYYYHKEGNKMVYLEKGLAALNGIEDQEKFKEYYEINFGFENDVVVYFQMADEYFIKLMK